MHEMSHEDRIAMARAIIAILDSWGLSDSQQVAVLALPKGTPVRAVRRYRENTPLPDDDAVRERVEHVVGIAEALRTTFPRNSQMGPQWLREPHRRFAQRAPLALIVEEGLSGLIAVRSHLDCAFAWQQTS